MNVYIYTLGCRLNQAESEAIADSFARQGFTLSSSSDAELVIVNSCTVTTKAEQKAEKASLLSLASHLERFLAEGYELHDAIKAFTYRSTDPFAFDASSFQYHSRAYLKIQDGCDNHCGYCRTTIARGASVSLDSEEVLKRALKLEEEGFHEIMLTGVNLTMYDHEGEGLGGLCEKLLSHLGNGTLQNIMYTSRG